MNQTLRAKILALFEVFIPDNASNKAVILELDRRGKIDNKKLLEVMFILMDEIEELKSKISYKTVVDKKKTN